jgi:hypothetical protein
MSLSPRRITLRLVLVLLVLSASALSAYVLLSPPRRWPVGGVTYTVDNRGLSSVADGDGGLSRTISAITSADAWNGAGAGTVVQANAGSVAGWSLGDGTPMLNFTDPENVCTGSCLAATFTAYYNSSTGYITDADIVTNSTGHSWTSQGEDPNGAGCSGEYYVEGVQVHEVGHGLGLAHTGVSGATMLPTISACSNSPATTESDDEAGIRALYNCTPHGYLCDPRYVTGVTCCPGRTCRSPYPGVPQYCL